VANLSNEYCNIKQIKSLNHVSNLKIEKPLINEKIRPATKYFFCWLFVSDKKLQECHFYRVQKIFFAYFTFLVGPFQCDVLYSTGGEKGWVSILSERDRERSKWELFFLPLTFIKSPPKEKTRFLSKKKRRSLGICVDKGPERPAIQLNLEFSSHWHWLFPNWVFI